MAINKNAGEAEKGYIQAELLHTIFHNENEHFTIARFKIHATNEDYEEPEVIGKGYFTNLQEGTTYSFYGQFEDHPKYGRQYSIESYQTYIPDTKNGLILYLSSDLFYGVGKKTAERIVEHLGDTAISKILNDPDIVSEIPRLNKETGKLLAKTLQENQGFEHIVVYLAKYEIGLKMSQKIYERYKDEAIRILEEDPYQYVFDIEGFGFKTADNIAKKNGLSETHPNRIGAGCVFILEQSLQRGHVFLPLDHCVQDVMNLLGTYQLTESDVVQQLQDLASDKTLVINDDHVYLPSLYYSEAGFAQNLERVMSKPIEDQTTLAELMKIIGDLEETEILSYGKEQFEAINQALHAKVMILTGGPGTGKTTVVKGILNAFAAIHDIPFDISEYDDQADFPFILTAPTGRAAKRLNESTGLPAKTIHRLLGWNGHDHFEKDEQNQLSGKFLIIDEFSMVDIWLAHRLFKAIPDDMQVLLVGDGDQLPSVGPGQVLDDLITCDLIPSVSLSEVYRQKEGSKIIQLAHDIKNDMCTVDTLKNEQDFSFIPCASHQLIEVITQIFRKADKKGIDLHDIQVLAPMYRSQVGITEINKHLQEIVNPKTKGKREKRFKNVLFRVGDKVIQLVNQPEDGVSNGDIGEIVAIFEQDENIEHEEQVVILFDEKEVVYTQKDYINFMHAYCISIHKSQGSEFPIVLLPVVSSYNRMLRKNLLYTAITRGQDSLIICGEQHAFMRGIHTLDTNIRYTSLPEQLARQFDGVSTASNEQNDESEEEKEISPYDFM